MLTGAKNFDTDNLVSAYMEGRFAASLFLSNDYDKFVFCNMTLIQFRVACYLDLFALSRLEWHLLFFA